MRLFMYIRRKGDLEIKQSFPSIQLIYTQFQVIMNDDALICIRLSDLKSLPNPARHRRWQQSQVYFFTTCPINCNDLIARNSR